MIRRNIKNNKNMNFGDDKDVSDDKTKMLLSDDKKNMLFSDDKQ
jgi:hypothetical protein